MICIGVGPPPSATPAATPPRKPEGEGAKLDVDAFGWTTDDDPQQGVPWSALVDAANTGTTGAADDAGSDVTGDAKGTGNAGENTGKER